MVRISAEENFLLSLLHCVKASSRACSASYPVYIGGLFPWGLKMLGREADHSPPSSAEVKNA
jgi:hypothetical protein